MCILLRLLNSVVLAVLLLAPFACGSENNENNLIVGGVNVHIEDVPYQTALFQKGFLICGGTIIGPRWIITSYHCVDTLDLAQYVFVVGSDDPFKGIRLHPKKIITRPEVSRDRNVLYDLALVLVRETITFSKKVNCLELLSTYDSLVPRKPAFISGFGTSEEGGYDTPLKAATIQLLPADICVNAYGSIMKEFMICAGYEEGGVDSCQGDSGGPLVVDGKLAGVIYYGRGCARPNSPGVYISIPWFYDWIVHVIREQPNPAERQLCGDE